MIINRVTCQPTPGQCERVVVLAPGGNQQNLIHAIEARLESTLGWRPARSGEVVEPDEGDVFDGEGRSHGGAVDPGQAELRYWQHAGWAEEVPPDRDELAILRATQATPSAIVVTIM